MEVLGSVTAVFAVVTAAKDLTELVMQIKDALEQVIYSAYYTNSVGSRTLRSNKTAGIMRTRFKKYWVYWMTSKPLAKE